MAFAPKLRMRSSRQSSCGPSPYQKRIPLSEVTQELDKQEGSPGSSPGSLSESPSAIITQDTQKDDNLTTPSRSSPAKRSQSAVNQALNILNYAKLDSVKQTQTQPKEDFIKALHHTKVLFKSLDIDDEVYIYLQKVLKESENKKDLINPITLAMLAAINSVFKEQRHILQRLTSLRNVGRAAMVVLACVMSLLIFIIIKGIEGQVMLQPV